MQADLYQDAATRCRQMAIASALCPDITVHADNHYIGVQGPEGVLDKLVAADLLDREENENEDEIEEEESEEEEEEEEEDDESEEEK